jgi:hypothetical protein
MSRHTGWRLRQSLFRRAFIRWSTICYPSVTGDINRWRAPSVIAASPAVRSGDGRPVIPVICRFFYGGVETGG